PLRPPTSPRLPYTTLFRSERPGAQLHEAGLALPEQLLAPHAGLVHLLREDVDVPDERPDALDVGAEVVDGAAKRGGGVQVLGQLDRKSTRLNSSHQIISYA